MEAPPSWANPNPQHTSQLVGVSQGMAAHASPRVLPRPPTADDHEAALFSDKTYSTLDEPVYETIMRDVRSVASKLKIVLMPLDRSIPQTMAQYYTQVSTINQDEQQQQQSQQQANDNNPGGLSDNEKTVIQSLKDWDLWGPLVLCLALAVILSFRAPTNQASLVFAAVFASFWVGSTIVTINAQLLGGTISFFQSLCVLGYSIFPLTLAALLIGLLRLIFIKWIWIHFAIIVVGYLWAIRASSVFIGLYIKPERRFLALYPVFFFYIFLSWMILLF